MIALRTSLAILLAVAAGVSLAQSRGDERGLRPPGISQGEAGGIPGVNRCRELKGAVREQCLRDVDASAGRSRAPLTTPSPLIRRDPVTDPPPQNPR